MAVVVPEPGDMYKRGDIVIRQDKNKHDWWAYFIGWEGCWGFGDTQLRAFQDLCARSRELNEREREGTSLTPKPVAKKGPDKGSGPTVALPIVKK